MDWERTSSRGIEVATAATAQEFIDALRPSNAHWWEGPSCPWVFRGHAHEDWQLLPSAWRPDDVIMQNSIVEATRRFDAVKPKQALVWAWATNSWSQPATFGENDAQLARDLTIRANAEYFPIMDFAMRCDELGMPVPLAGPGPDQLQNPNWLADANSPLGADEIIRWHDWPATLALAQHHGMPTRLLDWTRNPMAAAFFAVERLQEAEPSGKLVVWALHRGRANGVFTEGVKFPGEPARPTEVPRIHIVRPLTRGNPFLVAQAGLFTSITRSGIYFMKSGGKRPSLEEFVSEANPSVTVLRKLVLAHKHSADLDRDPSSGEHLSIRAHAHQGQCRRRYPDEVVTAEHNGVTRRAPCMVMISSRRHWL
jgi:hypothetical protein